MIQAGGERAGNDFPDIRFRQEVLKRVERHGRIRIQSKPVTTQTILSTPSSFPIQLFEDALQLV